MTGTIRKRGEKCYQIRVSMGFDPKSGKRRRHEKTIHGTRKEAQRYMREFVQSYETGRVVQASDQALKDYLLYWIDNAKAAKLAARTLYDYRQIVSLHFSGKIGKKALSHLRPPGRPKKWVRIPADTPLSCTMLVGPAARKTVKLVLEVQGLQGLVPYRSAPLFPTPGGKAFTADQLASIFSMYRQAAEG